jgi:hypothetical protein
LAQEPYSIKQERKHRRKGSRRTRPCLFRSNLQERAVPGLSHGVMPGSYILSPLVTGPESVLPTARIDLGCHFSRCERSILDDTRYSGAHHGYGKFRRETQQTPAGRLYQCRGMAMRGAFWKGPGGSGRSIELPHTRATGHRHRDIPEAYGDAWCKLGGADETGGRMGEAIGLVACFVITRRFRYGQEKTPKRPINRSQHGRGWPGRRQFPGGAANARGHRRERRGEAG